MNKFHFQGCYDEDYCKEGSKKIVTPLGVGQFIKGRAGGEATDLDWWETFAFSDEVKISAVPAQHFSGRKFTNGQSTLWSSWVIKTDSTSIYFSGDSGYGSHFKEIGEQYGPFDLAMMECGQYNKMWPDIHMFPEETAQAGLDVQASAVMPIHWGAFKLALHSWTDPIERVTKKANELQLPLVTPQIGEPIVIGKFTEPRAAWW